MMVDGEMGAAGAQYINADTGLDMGNRMPVGLKWRAHEERPMGTLRTYTGLAAALRTRLEFGVNEWRDLGIGRVRPDAVVRVDGRYYTPEVEEHEIDKGWWARGRWVPGSRNNATFMTTGAIRAARGIRIGEEILMAYSGSYWWQVRNAPTNQVPVALAGLSKLRLSLNSDAHP